MDGGRCKIYTATEKDLDRKKFGNELRIRIRIRMLPRNVFGFFNYGNFGSYGNLGNLLHTPTGKGLVWASRPNDSLSNLPCSSDINPVQQYPITNSRRNGIVQ